MNRKTITLVIGAVFYIVMIVLTVSARSIHNTSLPKVTAEGLELEKFIYEEADDEITEDKQGMRLEEVKNLEANNGTMKVTLNLGLPKELYDNQQVYIISYKSINGEERSVAKEITNLVIGQSNDKSYEVISGISVLDQVIMTGLDSVQDGCEVYVKD